MYYKIKELKPIYVNLDLQLTNIPTIGNYKNESKYRMN